MTMINDDDRHAILSQVLLRALGLNILISVKVLTLAMLIVLSIIKFIWFSYYCDLIYFLNSQLQNTSGKVSNPELNEYPTFISQVWISSTSEHLLLASQVFVLLIEELMMGKILKQIPYPLNFIKLKNLNKNMKYSQVPIRLKWNLMTDLNSNILLENKDVGAFTLLCSSQPLCNHFSRGTEHIMKRVALDSLPALSLLKHSYFFWA